MSDDEFVVIYSSGKRYGKNWESVQNMIMQFFKSEKEKLRVKFVTPETMELEAEVAVLRDAFEEIIDINVNQGAKTVDAKWLNSKCGEALTQTRASLLLEILHAVEACYPINDTRFYPDDLPRLRDALKKYRESK